MSNREGKQECPSCHRLMLDSDFEDDVCCICLGDPNEIEYEDGFPLRATSSGSISWCSDCGNPDKWCVCDLTITSLIAMLNELALSDLADNADFRDHPAAIAADRLEILAKALAKLTDANTYGNDTAEIAFSALRITGGGG